MKSAQTEAYEGRVNRVLDHIDRHLADPLTLEDLARVAAFHGQQEDVCKSILNVPGTIRSVLEFIDINGWVHPLCSVRLLREFHC